MSKTQVTERADSSCKQQQQQLLGSFEMSDWAEEANAAVKKFSRFTYPAMSKTQVSSAWLRTRRG